LNFETTVQDLSRVLAEVGTVVRVHIGTDRETGRSRGFAFAEFESDAVAADAIRRFDGFELGGRRLRVNSAEDRPSRPAGAPRFSAPPPGVATPRDMYAAGDPFGGDVGFGGEGGRSFKGKGSRRGLRARKRSLGH
jgi:RNA recognition motif-containing protein